MNKENEKTDKEKVEKASKEFSGIVDATSDFLKKTFPHAYVLIDKLRGVCKRN